MKLLFEPSISLSSAWFIQPPRLVNAPCSNRALGQPHNIVHLKYSDTSEIGSQNPHTFERSKVNFHNRYIRFGFQSRTSLEHISWSHKFSFVLCGLERSKGVGTVVWVGWRGWWGGQRRAMSAVKGAICTVSGSANRIYIESTRTCRATVVKCIRHVEVFSNINVWLSLSPPFL